MHALFAAAVLVTGIVTAVDDSPLPGCTVSIASASYSASKISDVDGKYTFPAVPPGEYEITFQLSGFREARRRLAVSEADHVIPAEDLEIEATEITLACGARSCTDDRPATRWDLPACSDYDLHTALIESMKNGDRSARDLLLQQYERADTWSERHRLGGELLNRVPDDRAIWNELFEHATNAVRFASAMLGEPSEEFTHWCAERQLDPDDYIGMAEDAFIAAGHDPRARPLLLEALRSKNEVLIFDAIDALAEQHDESSLPDIERALQNMPDRAEYLALSLVSFKSDRADAIALKYLSEEMRTEYLSWRAAEP